MTIPNVALHLLVVIVFAVFLLILYAVCRKADSKLISRFSSRRSSQMSLASKKSINPRQSTISLVTNATNPDAFDGGKSSAPLAFV